MNNESPSPIRLAESRIGETPQDGVAIVRRSLPGNPAMPALPSPSRALSAGAAFWFTTAVLGQVAFIAFIVLFFGGAIANGDLPAVNDKPHITGYAPGDLAGNLQFLGHALLGGLVTLAGMWQLVPVLRRRWPAVHRWNGRLFLTIALVVTLTGFSLVWLRGSRLGLGSDVSISLNGLLIVVFAVLAWRSAVRRDFTVHRRHALRAWLLVNGVWFLRIGIMLAGLLLTPLGFKIDYQGPIFIGVSVASWLLPLAVLELYFLAERSRSAGLQVAMGGLLGVLALATLAGSLAAAAFMWWPVL